MDAATRKTVAAALIKAANALEGESALTAAEKHKRTLGSGKLSYTATYKKDTVEVHADSPFEAQAVAADYFQIPHARYDVQIMLTDKGGSKQVTEDPTQLSDLPPRRSKSDPNQIDNPRKRPKPIEADARYMR